MGIRGYSIRTLLISAVIALLSGTLISWLLSVLLGLNLGFTLAAGFASVIATFSIATYIQNQKESETADDHQAVDKTEGIDTNGAEQQQTAKSTREQNGESTDSGTPAEQLTAPDKRSSLLRSDEQIIKETEELLGDRVTFYEKGTIEIEANNLNIYSEMMLHVIAKRIAYEQGLETTPKVTVEDLCLQTLYNKIDVLLFMDLAGDRLKPEHQITKIDYEELDNTTITANIKKLSESAEWAINEEQSALGELRRKPYYAKSALSEAQRHYESAREKSGNYTYFQLEVMNACTKVAQYPVEFGYDNVWKKLTRNADAALEYMADGSGIKTRKYTNRMQDLLDALEKRTDEEYRV